MALTATANESVINNIIERLNIPDCVLLRSSFNRPNLQYEVREKKKKTALIEEIADFIATRHANQTGIVYCFSRNDCEEVAQALRDKYRLKAQHYHAGMQPTERKMAQDKWKSGEANIIVPTVGANA
jgi:bloom syndrome protein